MSGLPALLSRPYRSIRLEWNSELSLLRVRTYVKPIQCYSLAAMAELKRLLDDIAANPGLVRHFVMTSDVPRVFNFGGDRRCSCCWCARATSTRSSCTAGAASS